MWTVEQLKAIETTGTNIIVSAGAGSGKTTVLTERVIRKLKSGVDINKLLILTFTEAASQEMKERIRSAIQKEGNLDRQLDLLTTAYICTFDSFSLSMVRKYHYLLNINSNVSIMDNNINFLQVKRFLDQIFDELYDEKPIEFKNFITRWCMKNDDNVKKGILSIFDKIDLIVDKDLYLNNYFSSNFDKKTFKNQLDLYEKAIKNEINDFIYYTRQFESYFKDVNDEKYQNSLMVMYDIVNGNLPINAFTADSIQMPKLVNAPKEVSNARNSWRNQKNYIISLIHDETDEIRYNRLIETKSDQEIIIYIIKELDERLQNFKKSYNCYTFMDIAKMAIKIFKENENIRNEFKYSLNEIMIDEYQDTSDIQEYFIDLIANNNVYMVGDIKQSIYRFRNANPYLFQSKYQNYSVNNGGIKIDLTNNFRSRKEVVENINTIFSDLMTLKLGGANYKESHIMKHGNTSYNNVAAEINHYADLLLYNPDEQKRISNEQIEAFIIAQDIRNKVDSHYQVMDKNTKSARDVKYSDFAILLEKSKHFDMYKKILNVYQIPLETVKNEQIIDDYDIKICHNILRLVASETFDEFSINDKYALTSILRSYLFEYSDEKIFDMFECKDFYSNEAYQIVKEIRSIKDQLSINEIIELIDDKFEIVSKANKIKNVKKILVHIEYLSNLSNTLSDLGYTLNDYVLYVDEVFSNDLKIEYKNELESVDNAVKIMTIHKSKGLEYNICYFPTLASLFNLNELKEDFLFDKNLGIILPTINFGKKDIFLKDIYKIIERNESISEEVRTLYVALTRAREKMIFVSEVSNGAIKNLKKSFNDLLENYFESIKYEYYDENRIEKFIELNDKIKKIDFSKLKSNKNKIDVDEKIYNCTFTDKKSFSKTIKEVISKEMKENLEFGTEIHHAFEIIDFKTKDFKILNIDKKYYDYIYSFLNCDLLSDVENGKIYKEYQFYDEESKISGSIDLMIEYQDHIDIIDYKLKNIDEEEYIKQLNGYKNYIVNKTNKNTNIYLYSILGKKYKKI